MGKVSRLFKGELKKIFLGPGIFFMTAFLILVLTIAPKLFNPTSKNDISSSVSFSTTNVESVYASFTEYKSDYDEKLENIENDVQELITNNANFKENLTTLTNEIYSLRMELDSLIFKGSEEDMADCLFNLIEKVDEFNYTYASYVEDYSLPLVLVTEELDHNIKYEASQLSKILNKAGDKSTKEFFIALNDSLENYKSAYNLKKYVASVKNLEYNNKNLKEIIKQYYTLPVDYKTELLSNISQKANQASSDEEFNISKTNIEDVKNLSLKYLSLTNSSYNAIQNSLYLEVSSNISDAEISSYLGFQDFNSYKFKESLAKHDYLLENKVSDAEYATMFSFNANTGKETNAFDYMYFTMEIASILIIAFTVILGAGMIAKEYSDGTIKLLAIRPYKRSKIMMSKILATMFFAFIFVLVSSIVTLITGYIIYGISLPSMLVVLNATTTFVLPIWAVFLIYLASLMIKIWVFALLSIMISTLFKSYIAAVCVSSGIYILNLILTFVSKGAVWLKYNIFANLDLFKFLGGSFTSTYSTSQNLTNLFLSPVFPDTSILLSAIVIVGLIFVLNLITFSIFKHRDIT